MIGEWALRLDSHMKTKELNELLGADLGRTAAGAPLYKWIWSEDPVLMHPMRAPENDYVTDPITGLVQVVPLYVLRKMCLVAEKQWVLCHWLESPSEDEWRKHFSYELEWPKGGQYYPTTLALDPGTEPDLRITQTAIDCIRACRAKSGNQVAREAEAALDKKEAETKDRLFETIREECTTYDHVPGKKDQVSYPAVADECLWSGANK